MPQNQAFCVSPAFSKGTRDKQGQRLNFLERGISPRDTRMDSAREISPSDARNFSFPFHGGQDGDESSEDNYDDVEEDTKGECNEGSDCSGHNTHRNSADDDSKGDQASGGTPGGKGSWAKITVLFRKRSFFALLFNGTETFYVINTTKYQFDLSVQDDPNSTVDVANKKTASFKAGCTGGGIGGGSENKKTLVQKPSPGLSSRIYAKGKMPFLAYHENISTITIRMANDEGARSPSPDIQQRCKKGYDLLICDEVSADLGELRVGSRLAAGPSCSILLFPIFAGKCLWPL